MSEESRRYLIDKGDFIEEFRTFSVRFDAVRKELHDLGLIIQHFGRYGNNKPIRLSLTNAGKAYLALVLST